MNTKQSNQVKSKAGSLHHIANATLILAITNTEFLEVFRKRLDKFQVFRKIQPIPELLNLCFEYFDEEHKAVYRELVEGGHEIGSHSLTHAVTEAASL